MLQYAPTEEVKAFLLVGRLAPLTDDFFVHDPPVIGDPESEKLCWSTTLEDATGTEAHTPSP